MYKNQKKREIVLFFCIIFGIIHSCSFFPLSNVKVQKNIEFISSSQITTQKSLRELAEENNLQIGTTTAHWETSDPLFLSTIQNEFNTMSPGYEAGWAQIHPEMNRYDFDELDNLVEMAEQYNMTLNFRGDPLWFTQYPSYMAYNNPNGSINQLTDLTKEELITLLDDHLETVFGRYQGKFDSIVVVNEFLEVSFNETTWQPLPARIRPNIWYEKMGSEYIAYALNKTHEVDPEAKLFINEGLWWCTLPSIAADKRDLMYNITVDLLNRGVPLHGVGLFYYFDSPLEYSWNEINWTQIHDEIKLFHDLGLEIQISELGMPIRGEITEEKLQKQAINYWKLMNFTLEFENVTLFNFWGIADDHSYLWTNPGTSAPMLFDEHYYPKPAYYALKERLTGVTEIYQHNFTDPTINFNPNPPKEYGWNINTPFKIQYEINITNQAGTGIWNLTNGYQQFGVFSPGNKIWIEFSRLFQDFGERLEWNYNDYMDVKMYGDGLYNTYNANYSVYNAAFFIPQVSFPWMPEWIRYVPTNLVSRIQWENIIEVIKCHQNYSYKDSEISYLNDASSFGVNITNINYTLKMIWNKTTGILTYYHRNHMNDVNLDLDLEFSMCDFQLINNTIPVDPSNQEKSQNISFAFLPVFIILMIGIISLYLIMRGRLKKIKPS